MYTLLEQYQADGFYLNRESIYPRELVVEAALGMDAIRKGDYNTGKPPCPSPWNPGDPEDILCKIEMPGLANHAIKEIVSHPNLGKLAAKLTGAKTVQVWWVQLLFKPQTSSPDQVNKTNVGMHQDFYYWRDHWEEDSEVFTAWVALGDVTPESGSMHFLKGSHKWGIQEYSDFFSQDLKEQTRTIRTGREDHWIEVSSELNAGGVSFHHPLTYHASGPNYSDAPRRGLAVHLRTENSRTKGGRRDGIVEFLDDLEANPIIYRAP